MACGGRSNLLSLANRVGWSTRSKAFEKMIKLLEEFFCTVDHATPLAIFLTGMLTRDLFAVAHLFVTTGCNANESARQRQTDRQRDRRTDGRTDGLRNALEEKRKIRAASGRLLDLNARDHFNCSPLLFS